MQGRINALSGNETDGSSKVTSALARTHGVLAGQDNFALAFRNVNYVSRSGYSKDVHILKDACGCFMAGTLTAILGPSGAGKTSMLNVLAGFKANGVSGHFELNGEARNLQAFRKMSSYIAQDFCMLELLTVDETMRVSADLKLPADTPSDEHSRIIDEILNLLNIKHCSRTLVRDLSGGERKRLSIAIELVTNPPIMFFDEPTSGLDSVASLQVMQHLQHLAHAGRIIVAVVHQPSSRLVKLFNNIVVMSRGGVLFCGAQRDMLAHFQQSGFTCPNYYNPADFVLEVASESSDKMAELIQRNRSMYTKDEPTQQQDQETKIELEILQNQESFGEDQVTSSGNYSDIRPKERVPFSRQFGVLLRRHLTVMSRNMLAVQLRVVMHIVVGALLGLVYWQMGNDAAKALSNVSCILFVILFIFCGNAMPSILLCQQDTAVFIREYLNGWYSIPAYYVSKLLADLPMLILCPSIFITITYYMTGQPSELERFLMSWGVCIATTAIAHFIGLVFGSLFQLQLSTFLVPAITIPFLLFSGFFIRLRDLSWFLHPLCEISFFRYILEGFMRAIYGYNRNDMECSVEFCYFKSPSKFLADFDMIGDQFPDDMFALILFVIILLVSFYLTLLLRIRKAQ